MLVILCWLCVIVTCRSPATTLLSFERKNPELSNIKQTTTNEIQQQQRQRPQPCQKTQNNSLPAPCKSLKLKPHKAQLNNSWALSDLSSAMLLGLVGLKFANNNSAVSSSPTRPSKIISCWAFSGLSSAIIRSQLCCRGACINYNPRSAKTDKVPRFAKIRLAETCQGVFPHNHCM